MQQHQKKTKKCGGKNDPQNQNAVCIIMLLFKIVTVIQYNININDHLTIKCNTNKYFIDFSKYNIDVNILDNKM